MIHPVGFDYRAVSKYDLNIHRPIVVTNTYTIDVKYDVVICDKAAPMTVNLFSATGSGRQIEVKSINLGPVTVDGNGSDTIDGSLTQMIYKEESMTVMDYDVGKWVIV